jgi:hypothetical protein
MKVGYSPSHYPLLPSPFLPCIYLSLNCREKIKGKKIKKKKTRERENQERD